MTTDSVSSGSDPRTLLSDVNALAHRVRRDQRVTWVALLVLAVVTLVGIPADFYGLDYNCGTDGCVFARRGVLLYWPPTLLLAYGIITFFYVRIARSRGLGARVLPYALTGVGLTVLFSAVWVAAALYFPDHPVRFPEWVFVFDRLIAPWGMIGVGLLVLSRLERNIALFLFTVGYLVVVLVPIHFGWGDHYGIKTAFLPQQVINGTVLLVGAIGFLLADRRRR